jgi:predicted AAA+ superfamily ATPase
LNTRIAYLALSSFPCSVRSGQGQREAWGYLPSIYNTVLLKDVVARRFNIKGKRFLTTQSKYYGDRIRWPRKVIIEQTWKLSAEAAAVTTRPNRAAG